MFKIKTNVRPLGNSKGMIVPSVICKNFELEEKDVLLVTPTEFGFEVRIEKLINKESK